MAQTPTEFALYTQLAKQEEENRTTVTAKKRIIHDQIEKKMCDTGTPLFTEDGQHFFVINSKTNKPALSQDFLRLCYLQFQISKSRRVEEEEGQEFVDFVETCRQQNATHSKKMRFQTTRPAAAFFQQRPPLVRRD